MSSVRHLLNVAMQSVRAMLRTLWKISLGSFSVLLNFFPNSKDQGRLRSVLGVDHPASDYLKSCAQAGRAQFPTFLVDPQSSV